MDVRYRNTLDHLVALQKHVLRNTALGRKMVLHRFLMVEVILLLICGLFAVNHDRLKVLLVFAGLSCLAWLFRERAVLMQFRKDFKRENRRDGTGAFHSERILHVSPSGLRLRMGQIENRIGWDQVARIDRDSRYIYILLTGVLHHVIPVSAFADAQAPDRFLETARSYQAQA